MAQYGELITKIEVNIGVWVSKWTHGGRPTCLLHIHRGNTRLKLLLCKGNRLISLALDMRSKLNFAFRENRTPLCLKWHIVSNDMLWVCVF